MKVIQFDSASLPERPPRTVLEPYAAVIEELLARGWGYRDVARILGEQFGVSTSKSSLARLVRRRRPHKAPAQLPARGAEPVSGKPWEEPIEFHFDMEQPLRLKGRQ